MTTLRGDYVLSRLPSARAPDGHRGPGRPSGAGEGDDRLAAATGNHELIRALAAGPAPGIHAVNESARRHGMDPGAPTTVVVGRPEGIPARHSHFSMRQYMRNHGGIIGIAGEKLLVILQGDHSEQRARNTVEYLSKTGGVPFTAGLATLSNRPSNILDAYLDASRCLDSLLSMGRTGECASRLDLGFFGLVMHGRREEIADFVRHTIGTLTRYDDAHATDLVPTLDAFFDASGRLGPTAARMRVHVNTVKQRLNRIASLLGDDWRTPDRLLELRLALRLRPLADLPAVADLQ